jgi:hypothetical protein
MKVKLRMTHSMFGKMIADLRRPHGFAYERVGFLFCKQSSTSSGALLLAFKYVPIRDEQYIRDESVGARFDSSSIREAMQVALSEGVGAFHVHLHDHAGTPRLSGVDVREMQALIPCFVNVCPDRVHGALVLSLDSATANGWSSGESQGEKVRVSVVGSTLRIFG